MTDTNGGATRPVANPDSLCGAAQAPETSGRGRRLRSIRDVVKWDLCCGCGACYSACSRGAVDLLNIEASGIRPRVDAALCGTCTDCLSICPGSRVDGGAPSGQVRPAPADELGPYLEIWEGFATDPEIRFRGSSGGVLTALALYCLEHEQMSFALHAAMDESQPWRNATVQSATRSELLERAGSRYSPASPCDSLRNIEDSTRPCVFIGKPCDTAAVTMLRTSRPALDRNLGLVLACFCAGTPSSQGTLKLLESMEVAPDRVSDIRYRGEGWPGRFRVRSGDDAAEASLSYHESWARLTAYRPLRCHLCPDGMGQVADITCGDAWHRYRDDGDSGRSIVIVRSRRGQEILARAKAAGYLELCTAGPADVLRAQPGLVAKRREVFGRLLARQLLMLPTPEFHGFCLFRGWMRLTLMRKAASIGGTLRRVIFGRTAHKR